MGEWHETKLHTSHDMNWCLSVSHCSFVVLENGSVESAEGTRASTLPQYGLHQRHSEVLLAELLRQSREEHTLRMKILQLKHRFWQMRTANHANASGSL